MKPTRVFWRTARQVLAAIGTALLAASATAADQPRPQRPNIIFILADDLGWGDLGCYGQKKARTPNLDRMASEGIRFTQFYSGSTVCAPSRCCLMTGLHTGHARIRGNAGVCLQAEDFTIAEMLKGAGYSNANIGKWGLGSQNNPGSPNLQGFDEANGYLSQVHAHDYYTDHLFRNGEKYTLAPMTYSHDLFTSRALEYIHSKKDAPFFLYLTYTIPHANNEGLKTGNGMPVPSDAPYTRENWPQVEKNFAAMVTRMDADVGRVLAELKELGLDQKTLVFFTSDNGPHKEGGHDPDFFDSNGKFRGIKRDLTEGGIRVPMIARWPGVIPAGKVSDQVWAFWDVLPTIAEITQTKAPEKIDGRSAWDALLGKQLKGERTLYWEFFEKGFQQALRQGNWKAIRPGGQAPTELYDLSRDPGEEHNLAASNPQVVAKCEALMASMRTDSPDFPTTGTVTAKKAKVKKK